MKKAMVFEGILAILLIVLLFAVYVMVAESGNHANDWEINVDQPVWDIYPGNDGTLYAFQGPTGNTIIALDYHGNIKWKFQVPGQWRALNTYYHIDIEEKNDNGYSSSYYPVARPVFAADNGTLYVYVRENRTTYFNHYPWEKGYPTQSSYNDSTLEERLIAISPDGKLLWNVWLGNYYIPASDVSVYAKNGMVYAFYSYNATVFDSLGTRLFALNSISSPPSVDEAGRVYAIACEQKTQWYDMGYREPLDILKAFYPNGSVYWVNFTGKPIKRPSLAENVRYQYGHLPLYQDHTLYVPLRNGIMVMNTDGSIKWSIEFANGRYTLFPMMPIDANGNIYLSYSLPGDYGIYTGNYLSILDENGSVIVTNETLSRLDQFGMGDPYTGRIYDIDDVAFTTRGRSNWANLSLDDLTTYDVAAYDLLHGTVAWDYTIPIDWKSSFTVNNRTLSIFDEYAYISDWAGGFTIDTASKAPDHYQVYPYYPIKISSTKDTIYLSLFTANYESPIVPGRSKCTYSGGIYAVSKNGSLLWYRPTDAFASSIAANNGTVYYSTRNGRIGAGGMDAIAGGITLAALAYIFFRFFLVGAVARAKDRLGKNENRNSILRLITDNPGLTVFDISRSLSMNIGTVRYHMFILELNHRVFSYKADDKHVRFFTNSNSYSKDEQFVISLMRRDGVRRILELLTEKPGLTNLELTNELKIQESAVSRYMKELSEKGIVAKGRAGDGANVYSISGERGNVIASAMKRLRA